MSYAMTSQDKGFQDIVLNGLWPAPEELEEAELKVVALRESFRAEQREQPHDKEMKL